MPVKSRPELPPRKIDSNKPLIEAEEPLVLKVQRSDLRGAKKGDPANCVAAHALTRQEHVKNVRVFRSKIFVEYPDKVMVYQTPNRLREDTIAFDRGAPRKFMEGDYTLHPLSPSRRMGADKRPSNRGGGKDKRGKAQAHGKRRRKIEGVRPRASAAAF